MKVPDTLMLFAVGKTAGGAEVLLSVLVEEFRHSSTVADLWLRAEKKSTITGGKKRSLPK